MGEYSNVQIIAQAGQSMLEQANQILTDRSNLI